MAELISVDDTKNWQNFRGKLNALFDRIGFLDVARTWTALQTFDGGALIKGASSSIPAGYAGEYKSTNIPLAFAVSLTSIVAADVGFVDLEAGVWQLSGSVVLRAAGGGSLSVSVGWISETSATLPTVPNGGMYTELDVALATNSGATLPIAPGELILAAPARIYLSAFAIFGSGTVSAYGFIGARRI